MAEEYRAVCKDCNTEFGYSEASLTAGSTRGLSRPERCPECRKNHSREGRSIGIPQIKVQRSGPRKPDKALSAGRLGKIIHPERPHKKVHVEGKFGKPDTHIAFGITDDDSRQLIETMERCQVTVVVGPTGSGKSTFLPYRLMVPPEEIDPDIFTRYGQIVITQPRIQATRSIARFVAQDLHGSSLGAGFDVGFRHSGAPASDWRNKLVYITDGTLINWIVSGQISNLSVIMIDEAHERSLNIDLILGLLKKQLPRFPHLKLIIASATINAALFQNYFGGPGKVGLLTFRGLKQHRIDAYFPPGDMRLVNDYKVPGKMATKITEILEAITEGRKREGDILGFLPGENEINKCVEAVRAGILQSSNLRGRGINVYPLFTSLPRAAQDLALAKKSSVVREKVLSHVHDCLQNEQKDRILVLMLDRTSASETKKLVADELEARNLGGWHTVLVPSDGTMDSLPKQIVFATHDDAELINSLLTDHQEITDRRVIVATNVAETSLTVDGIVYVVDSGLIKESRWDPEPGADSLVKVFHSRAGCRQRWGRAGRVRDGEAHMLYTDVQFENEDVFPAYTTPEIQRSALDQVVLKAKTAGIDNITEFDWIEHPPAEEIKRAPAVLRKMGAMDEDGDLTGLGVELQGYVTDVPIANLLVAADHFACGVEMATLAALLTVRLRGGLLKWDPRWDFATRNSVEEIYRGFAEPCRDDLELYLKIYSVWAEASDEAQRAALCRHFFLDHNVLAERVSPGRDTFMDMLAIAKKTREDRTIAFNTLDRLRFVLAVNLPENRLFEVKDGNICCFGGDAGLPVVIDENSTLAVEQPAYFLACGKRIEEGKNGRRLLLSCLVRLEEEWIGLRNKPLLLQAYEIAGILQPSRNEDVKAKTRLRLFRDIQYPCFSVWWLVEDGQGELRFGELHSYPEPIQPVLKEGVLDKGKDITFTPPDDVSPLAGIDTKSEIPIPLASDAEPEDAVSESVIDLQNDEDKEDVHRESETMLETVGLGLLQSPDYQQARQYHYKIIQEDAGSGDHCIVVGYDFSDPAHPAIRVRRFQGERYQDIEPLLQAGSVHKATGVGTLGVEGEEKALVVRLPDADGAEYIMDARELSFSGRWNFPDMLIGKAFDVMAIKRQGALRLTHLPLLEKELHSYLLSSKREKIPCRLSEKKGADCYFVLTGMEEKGFLEGAHMKLPKNKEENNYTIGQTYQLFLSSRFAYGEAHEFIEVPPSELPRVAEEEKHGQGIFWNERQQTLHTKKPMTMDLRRKLEKLGSAPEYLRAIARLYLHSNKVAVWLEDKGGYLEKNDAAEQEFFRQDLVPVYEKGDKVFGRISEVRDNYVFVVLDQGGKGQVLKKNLCLDGEDLLDPREVVSCGQRVKCAVLNYEVEQARTGTPGEKDRILIALSLRDPDDFRSHEYDRYALGSEHQAQIIHVDDRIKFARARLDEGVTGKITVRNICRYFVKRISDHITRGQMVDVIVQNCIVDPENLEEPVQITLALKNDPILAEFEKRLEKYETGSIHPGRATKIDDIRDFALVELEEGIAGLLHKSNISYSFVENVSDHLELHQELVVKIKQRVFDPEAVDRPFRLVLSHKDAFSRKKDIPEGKMGLVIGTKWTTIKDIQKRSGCRINMEKDGLSVTIIGNSENSLEKAAQMIDVRLKAPSKMQIGSKSVGHKYGARKHSQNMMKVEVVIPEGRIFWKLVGEGGETVRRLKRESGCHIFSSEGLVNVAGESLENIHKAVSLIQKIIPEAKVRERN